MGSLYQLQELSELTKQFASLEVRGNVEGEIIRNIIATFKSEVKKETHESEILLGCLRSLRNVVAGVKANQEIVASLLQSHVDFWNFLDELMQKVKSEQILNILRCSIQLIGNLLVGQTKYQEEVFSSVTRILEKLFSEVADHKCLNFACMVILTLQKNEENLKDVAEDYHKVLASFLPRILKILESEEVVNNSDFADLCFVSYLENSEFLKFLTSKERASLVPNLPHPINISTMTLLSTDFTYLTDILLTTNTGSVSQLDPTDILTLTQLMAESSGQDQYRSVLQSHKSLVLNTLYLLKMVHEAGKEGVENLKVLGKLSDVQKREGGDKDNITESPTFGFKENLIQMLTNLVWDHTENKTTVGELEGLALILDCSQMDARNPLITQRVVLAVRALTNGHTKNQEILAGLKKVGAADASLLKELGMERDREGKIRRAEVD